MSLAENLNLSSRFLDLEPNQHQSPYVVPQRSCSAPPDENQGRLTALLQDDDVKKCYLVTNQCGHQSVEPQPGRNRECYLCFATSLPCEPSDRFALIARDLRISTSDQRSISFATEAKELLETLEKLHQEAPSPEFHEKTVTSLKNFLRSDILLRHAEGVTFLDEDPSHPTISLKHLFTGMESTNQYATTLKAQLNTAQEGDSVLMPLSGSSFLIEFRKTSEGFCARVYTQISELLTHHTTDIRGTEVCYFPIEYAGIPSSEISSLVDALNHLSLGDIQWFPGLGYLYQQRHEERFGEMLYRTLERATRIGKTAETSHLLSYHSSSPLSEERLVHIWLKQYAFDAGAESWYRCFQTALHKHRSEVLHQWALSRPKEISEKLLSEAIEAEDRACVTYDTKKQQHSWKVYSPPSITPPAPTPTELFRHHVRDSVFFYIAHEKNRDFALTYYGLKEESPQKVFKEIPCRCGHIEQDSQQYDERDPLFDRCDSCISLPISECDIQSIVDWDVGSLNRVNRMMKTEQENTANGKRLMQFWSVLQDTSFPGVEYLRSLLLHLEHFQGPSQFPQEKLRDLLTAYCQHKKLQSSTLTQILKTEISPTLFTSLAHLQTAQLKGNQTLQLLYKQLDQLQVGQEIIFPFTSMSHQVLIAFDQIQPDFAIVRIFNSGDGLSNHEEAFRKRSKHEYYYPLQYRVPIGDLKKIADDLANLVLPTISWTPDHPNMLSSSKIPDIESLYTYFRQNYQKYSNFRLHLPYREQTLRSCQRDSLRAWIRDFCFRRGDVGVQWYRKFSLYCLQKNTEALAKTLGNPNHKLDHLDVTMQLAIDGIAQRAKKAARPQWAQYFRAERRLPRDLR